MYQLKHDYYDRLCQFVSDDTILSKKGIVYVSTGKVRDFLPGCCFISRPLIRGMYAYSLVDGKLYAHE